MADVLHGTLPALTGYIWTTLELDGTLGAVTGAFYIGPQFDAEIPAVTGTFSSYPAQSAYLSGRLGGITGVFSSKVTYASFSGHLGEISSSFTGLSGNLAEFSGSIEAISGTFLAKGFIVVPTFSGILPSLTGSFDATWTGSVTLAGTLPSIFGAFTPRLVSISRRGIVMNLSNYAVTHYENFNFDSVAHYGDLVLGANENGLYLLGGNDDLGQKIVAEIESGKIDLSGKIPREAWMAYESDGDEVFTVRTDKAFDAYEYPFVPESEADEGRAKVGKGIKGRFFKFGIKNVSGTRLHVNILRVFGDIIKRLSR